MIFTNFRLARVQPAALLALILGIFGTLAGGQPPSTGSTGSNRPASSISAAGRGKYLLLDPRNTKSASGVEVVLGEATKERRGALLIEEKPWEVRFDNLYANVMYDPQDRRYKLWYNPFIIDEVSSRTGPEERQRVRYKPGKREMGVCYATSADGIVWEKPALGLVEFNGSKQNNLVLRNTHGTGVRWDPFEADPARRYKAFSRGGVTTSADGLHWSEFQPCPEIQAAGDTHNNAFWDERSQRYVGITRLWDKERLVGRTESPDFRQWTKAVEVLRGTPEHQTYALIAFPYGRINLGLVMIFHPGVDMVDCELAMSTDTIHWERICPGTPLIPRGAAGSFDSGCIYAAADPIVQNGEMRIYYGGSDGPHTNWRKGALGLARMRPDGFAALKTKDKSRPGTVVTQPIQCSGRRLHVNVDAKGGRLRVGVVGVAGMSIAECQPVAGDAIDAVVTWRGGRDLGAMKGRSVQLEFELESAALYSFWLDD